MRIYRSGFYTEYVKQDDDRVYDRAVVHTYPKSKNYPNGRIEYWVNGLPVSKEQFDAWMGYPDILNKDTDLKISNLKLYK